MSLLTRVTNLLTERGITIKQAERDCGLSNGSIRRWNVSSPSTDNLIKIADYLKSSTDDLLCDDRKFATADKGNTVLSTDELILLTLFNKLDQRDQIDVLDTVKNKYKRSISAQKKSDTEKSMSPFTVAARDGTVIHGMVSDEDEDALALIEETYPD